MSVFGRGAKAFQAGGVETTAWAEAARLEQFEPASAAEPPSRGTDRSAIETPAQINARNRRASTGPRISTFLSGAAWARCASSSAPTNRNGNAGQSRRR